MDLKKISCFYHKLPYKILKLMYGNNGKKVRSITAQTMISMCKLSEEFAEHYYSFRERPQNSDEIIVTIQNNEYAKCAIVLQGPILVENDFTVESIRLYKRFYPSSIIIVSTWSDEKPENIKSVREAGAIIVQSEKPSFGGPGNINFQLVNTKAGILKAKEFGVQYICKTRTDQRLYHPNVMEYMVNLLSVFPPTNLNEFHMQNKRIVCCGMEYGNMFYPFFMSDFFYFGTEEEMSRLFSFDVDMRQNVPKAKGHTRKEVASGNMIPEIQIMRQYARTLGFSDECSVKNYWDFIKRHLICINKDNIGLYWPKYTARYSEHIRNGYFYNIEAQEYFKTYNWDFIHWLNLYNETLMYKSEYEKYADLVI